VREPLHAERLRYRDANISSRKRQRWILTGLFIYWISQKYRSRPRHVSA